MDGGLISRYAVLSGNPKEPGQVLPSVEHHLERFKKPARLLAGERGTHSARGERYARDKGISQVVIPKPGAKLAARLAYERQGWFRRGRDGGRERRTHQWAQTAPRLGSLPLSRRIGVIPATKPTTAAPRQRFEQLVIQPAAAQGFLPCKEGPAQVCTCTRGDTRARHVCQHCATMSLARDSR